MTGQGHEEGPRRTRCGMVSIVGRPNVGKSTLLNRVLREKVSIVSPVPQTTRNSVRGIHTDRRGQIVFIDTPGIHRTRDRLDRFMNTAAYAAGREADVLIHLVDSSEPVGPDEEEIVDRLVPLRAPVILGLNKADLGGKRIPEYIALWERKAGRPVREYDRLTLLPLSGTEGIHVDTLLDILFDLLPPGPPLYPEDTLCDVPRKMALADIIREKLFLALRDELPHALAVIIEEAVPEGRCLHIRALIVVEKDSQKRIVIGRGGALLKRVGTIARREIEALLEEKVFLELYVKTRSKWRQSADYLQEMGYAGV